MISVVKSRLSYKDITLRIICGGLFLFISGCTGSSDDTAPSTNKKETTKDDSIDTADYISLNGHTQGTTFSVIYKATTRLSYKNEIDSLLVDFDNSLSTYNASSFITILNEYGRVTPDEQFIECFRLADEVYHETNGAFNPAIYPIIELWGDDFKNIDIISQEEVDSTLKLCNYKLVEFNKDSNAYIVPDGVKVEMNAIAQGYSVDRVAGFLEAKGINDYMVEIGGELITSGKSPQNGDWIIGIEQPKEEKSSVEDEFMLKVPLRNRALATSGSYRKFKMVDGKRLSHTIDPSTGYPSSNNLLSVTVIAKSAAIADAYATAFMVMGLENAKEFLQGNKNIRNLEVYLIYDVQGELKTWNTRMFEEFLP